MSENTAFSDYPRYQQLAFAAGSAPALTARFKTEPEDFQVEEMLGFELSGEGEHLWLWTEARDMNTDFLVRQLASAFGLTRKDVGYSGKKDRRAITRQWFSVHLPGRFRTAADIVLPEEMHPNVTFLDATLHSKKLRRGAHQKNLFRIRLRDIFGDFRDFEERAAVISERGFPNYFGAQRFGRNESNIEEACAAIAGQRRLKRQARDRVYSTLRGWDFNRQLNKRIQSDTWQKYLPGDTLQLSGSHSLFQPEAWDDVLQERLDQGDIQIAGILPGKGDRHFPLEEAWYEPEPALIEYLADQRVEQGTRPLAVRPTRWQTLREGNDLMLSFGLPRGAYATALLRELVILLEAGQESD